MRHLENIFRPRHWQLTTVLIKAPCSQKHTILELNPTFATDPTGAPKVSTNPSVARIKVCISFSGCKLHLSSSNHGSRSAVNSEGHIQMVFTCFRVTAVTMSLPGLCLCRLGHRLPGDGRENILLTAVEERPEHQGASRSTPGGSGLLVHRSHFRCVASHGRGIKAALRDPFLSTLISQ